MKPSQYISIIVLVIVIVNFLLMVFKKINIWVFWGVTIFAAIVAFWIVPKMRKRGI